jgi:DNA-binding PadR family transcriptional regulator
MLAGVLELAILGLLKERPMHGYDLRKRLRDELGPFSNLSFGSLYPALRRLERGGAVETDVADGGGRPGEAAATDGAPGTESSGLLTRRATTRAAAALGGRGTRARKVYEITEHGEVIFEQMLEAADGSDDPRGFLLRLGFARHLSPAARLRLLERRRLQLLDRVERARRLLAQRRGQLDRYNLAILEHSLETAVADLAWVDRLLGEELGQPLPELEPAGQQELSPPAPRAARRRPEEPSPQDGTSVGGIAGIAGIAGILHAGRLRRRAEGARPAPPQSRRKEQIGR